MSSRPVSLSDQAMPPPGWGRWWVASRPKTLTMAVAPVIVGASLAWAEGSAVKAWVFLLSLACATLIQVGTNLLNDVTDFEKGNDKADRLGPLRITAAGWATPREVRRAALAVFLLALATGLVLVWTGGLFILALGLISLIAAWAYSGGPKPVSHGPFGELFVLAFFGLVGVIGSHYLQAGAFSFVALPTGVAIGAMASAVLLLNNYRDLAMDKAAGRRTLAALLGPARAQLLYAVFVLLPLALPPWLALRNPPWPGAWLALLAAPLMWRVAVAMRRAQGAALNPVLAQTALAQFVFSLLLSIGVLL
ncbi:MAG: 1,4-dihydroxy-2-naphthoate polyprenyltransferase [Gammaproteobacteria bacterium]|nr:1,4-dihydroxy-2-naphthoate polyprenyltransferase [Gammaproteobacteria bacterium]